jgi:hypothetical protein
VNASPYPPQRVTFPEQRTALSDGTVYTPFLADGMPGLECTRPGSATQCIYMNPSDHSDDGDTPNVFVYQGSEGDPSVDTPIHHYTIWQEPAHQAQAPARGRLRGAASRLSRASRRT